MNKIKYHYFISYQYNTKVSYGFGSVEVTLDSVPGSIDIIRSIERQIQAGNKGFEAVNVLYFKLLKMVEDVEEEADEEPGQSEENNQ